MNLDQMTPAARSLAERRGHRQTEARVGLERRSLTIGGEDLTDLLSQFEYQAEPGGRTRGTVTLEGGAPRSLPALFGSDLVLRDGAGERRGVVTAVEVDQARSSGTRVRVDFEGWE